VRNKNTFIALLLVFTGICLYHLTLTVIQFQAGGKLEDARKAAVAADSKPDSLRTAADSSAIKEYNDLMSDKDFQDRYDWTVKNSFNLGLDLQGGMFVTLEVGVDNVVRQLAGSAADATFEKVMQDALKRQNAGEQKSFVQIFDESFQRIAPNVKLGTYFASSERGISFDTDRQKILDMLKLESESAIDRTYNIIRTRIDQFGVVSPNLQKQSGTGRILLELPGVKDPDRVRKLLRSTAKLEFWETHTIGDAYKVLTQVNDRLKVIKGITVEADTTKKDSANNDVAVEDSTAADTAAMGDEEKRAKLRRENPLFAVLQTPDPKSITESSPVVGYASANDTAKINAFFRYDDVKRVVPDDMKFAWTFKALEGADNVFTLVALKSNLEGKPALEGDAISSARMNFDQTGRSIVEMGMNAEGSEEWARITGENVGKSVAIVLDGYVYSFPTVQGRISGGNSQISGNFTIEEAKDMANILKAGQLPVPARIQGEDVVGPTLGAENITSGIWSFFAALLVTMIFMVFYYAKAGWTANLALLANMVFLLGMSAGFNIVLTLPGIAAMVLTIGMAVDANVLIFERIREELADGKTMKAGIKAGFANAFSSIMDGNITTFLTGVVLYVFGVGPIRGFAVSLMIGIITTLVAALLISRFVLEWYANRGGDAVTFGTPLTMKLFKNIKLNAIANKKKFYMISGSIMIVGLISIATIGFKTGVDFDGGRQLTIALSKGGIKHDITNAEIETIRKDLGAALGNTSPVIKTLANDNQLLITTSYKAADRDATDEVLATVNKVVPASTSGAKVEVLSLIDVGPSVASDITRAAYLSVIFSLLIIFVYVLVRFRKWQYSFGAVVALFHDVMVMLTTFSLLSIFDAFPINMEIDQNIIAALLTIVGFSINDTVVIFDRIREHVAEHGNKRLRSLIDLSIDQTLSRTIITSLTVFLTVIVLLFFGGEVIRGFMFAMLVGMISGTYSTIYIASPIALDLIEREERNKGNEAAGATLKPATV